MKREILFKARRADGKGWVEGFYTQNHKSWIGGFAFGSYFPTEAIPETVCQYTGLDEPWINGKQVFESDKLYNKDREETCVVVWVETKAAWFVEYADGEQHYLFMSLGNLNEVTGNIHDK
jgi:hypothetical protein